MIWNSLPNSLKEIKSLQLFKRKLKCSVRVIPWFCTAHKKMAAVKKSM